MSHIDKLKDEIGNLSRSEREHLMTVLAYHEANDQSPISREQRFILQTIAELSDNRATPVFEERFIKSYGRRKFDQQCDEVFTFLEDSRKYLHPVQMNGLIEVCLKALAASLRDRTLPVTPKTMMDSISSLPAAVDKQFPGYAAAKLLHFAVH